jgi:hypothetical protein
MKGGRPAVYLGARVKDKRIRYLNSKGRTRAFYARWRPQLKRWECHLSGYGLQSRQWFSSSQTMALAKLRLTPCLWDWRQVAVDTSVLWDGIPDIGYSANPDEVVDLFAVASVAPNAESAKALPAAPKDRVNSQGGAGDVSPAVINHEVQAVDHSGLEVGELPADQVARYFPAHASQEGGA